MPVQTRAQARAAAAAVITAQPAPAPARVPAPQRAPPAREPPQARLHCAICFEPMCWPHRLRCGHAFHARCLQTWRGVAARRGGVASCPMCRGQMDPDPWHTQVEQAGLLWMLWCLWTT